MSNSTFSSTLVNDALLRRELFSPYLLPSETPYEKRKIALLILQKSNEDLLLMDPYAFQFDIILAGLTEKHIEFLALNATQPIKKFLLEGLSNKETLQSTYNLAISLDDSSPKHKGRILSVIQYVRDNHLAFRF
jgi:hypothetical protein